MADLRQIVFGKTGHFHSSSTVEAVLQHGTSHFEFAFLFKLLCDGYKCVSMLCQFANKGFGVCKLQPVINSGSAPSTAVKRDNLHQQRDQPVRQDSHITLMKRACNELNEKPYVYRMSFDA